MGRKELRLSPTGGSSLATSEDVLLPRRASAARSECCRLRGTRGQWEASTGRREAERVRASGDDDGRARDSRPELASEPPRRSTSEVLNALGVFLREPSRALGPASRIPTSPLSQEQEVGHLRRTDQGARTPPGAHSRARECLSRRPPGQARMTERDTFSSSASTASSARPRTGRETTAPGQGLVDYV